MGNFSPFLFFHVLRTALQRVGLVIAIVVTLGGCASHLVIKSDPAEATVYALKPTTGERISLGTTPVDFSRAEFAKRTGEPFPSNDFVELILEKSGFQTEHYVLPTGRLGTLTNGLNVKLTAGAKEDHIASELLRILFMAQKFAVQGDYERAQIEIDKALQISPRFPRAISMRGSVYYLQHKYEESLKSFEEALTLDAQMDDAVKMISKLRKLLNRPATGTGGARS
ncbi:tetratricopeptide repeat protein [Bdellovibrionota bacterium FG-1]